MSTNDNERPGALREGVSWETDCNRNGSNATMCIFSSDTECMVWISVQYVHVAPFVCLLQLVNLENYQELTWELTGKPWRITPA